MANRIAREVAEASRATPAKSRRPRVAHTDVLIDCARRVERLQTKRRRIRKELRQIEADLKHAKRELKAMAARVSGKDDEL